MDIENVYNSKINGHCSRKKDDVVKPKFRSAFMEQLQMVNDPTECIYLLKRLNDAISTLLMLQDAHFTEYIWNSGKDALDKMEEEGLNEDYFYSVEKKLRELRNILVGDNLDFEWLTDKLYDEVLAHEAYWSEYYEELWKKADREIHKLKKELEGKNK